MKKKQFFFTPCWHGINCITARCLTKNDGAFDLLQLERTWTDVQRVISALYPTTPGCWKRHFLRHHIEPRASDPGKISLIKFVYRTRFWYLSVPWYCWSGGGKGIWPGKNVTPTISKGPSFYGRTKRDVARPIISLNTAAARFGFCRNDIFFQRLGRVLIWLMCCLSVCLSVSLSVYLSVCLSVCPQPSSMQGLVAS